MDRRGRRLYPNALDATPRRHVQRIRAARCSKSLRIRASELRHLICESRIDALTAQHGHDRTSEDLEVEARTEILEVVQVHLEALVPRRRIPAINADRPGQPGAAVVPPTLSFIIARHVVMEQWPRPDEAHVAAQDVPQLGQLVDA